MPKLHCAIRWYHNMQVYVWGGIKACKYPLLCPASATKGCDRTMMYAGVRVGRNQGLQVPAALPSLRHKGL